MELYAQHWPNPPSLPKKPADPPTAEREKLVFLHGMGGIGALWRPIAATLEDRFDLLAPDQRGHGQSQIPTSAADRAPPKYTPLDYGQDVVDTIAARSFHPCWLIGHSMGVRTACAAAYLRPEWVRGLILIDLGFSGVAGGGLGETLAEFLRKLPASFSSRDAARQFMTTHCPDPSIAQYLMAVSVRTASGEIHFPFDHAALIQTIQAARDGSVRSWVESLAARGMPIAILRGQNSRVWSQEDFEAEKSHFANFPNLKWVTFPGTGHGLPFEARIDFTKFLTQWVDSHP
jgi:pimeloyl-ACP methyl ester carboxylesterase